jgi:hypothetical protein
MEIVNAEVRKDGCEVGDEESLFSTFSSLKAIQCLESLDKLQWFRKMRVQA